MRVLGIEGTAWAASAAIFDGDDVWIETDAYVPESGGIDPRESADHMADAVPSVIEAALEEARRQASEDPDSDPSEPPIDAVAFSRGPGLGPCLRITGTAARALADTLDVPLVGVNHMVAHLEIGRHQSGFDSPVCLNASGANAHVLGYRGVRASSASPGSSDERRESDGGRYRVLGETMDTGVGNALDKFARHVGWSHPGGPKIEEAAADGDLVELPYVVKGMDFSFSGIVTAAQDAYDDGVPVEDLSFSLQETIFAMLTEVAERALSLTGSDELVLGGGVGQNARLREMLEAMCDERGADFYAPEPRFLRDNAGMIAVTGAKMLEAGDTIAIEDSAVRPDFRPDEVPVTWREGESVSVAPPEDRERRGAEAIVQIDGGRVVKRRVPKSYRHPELDRRLRTERTRLEARLTSEARRAGVPTPVLRDVDPEEGRLVFEFVGDRDLGAALSPARVRRVGEHLAAIHAEGFVHGDPTTRNVRVDLGGGVGEEAGSDEPVAEGGRIYLIDFGLGYYTGHVEDRAMDLHVFEQSLYGTADDPDSLCDAFEGGYAAAGDAAVLDRLREIEGRGRYQ